MRIFEYLRFWRQAPNSRPPRGYYDLRVSKANGSLVLVDDNGTEAAVGSVTSVAGRTGAVTLAQSDITPTYGELLFTSPYAGSEPTVDATPRKMTTNSGGMTTSDVTSGSNALTVPAGVYKVSFSLAFSGTASKTYKVAIYTGTNPTTIIGQTKLDASGSVTSISGTGILEVNESSGYAVSLYQSSTDGGTALTTVEGRFSLTLL